MFKLVDSHDLAGGGMDGADAQALEALRALAMTALAETRHGSIFRFGSERAAVEVVLGFEPGRDRVVLMASPAAHGSARVLATEECGSVVIFDGMKRRIVLQGVTLDQLMLGDVEVAA